MTRSRSLLFAAIGAAAISYSYHSYGDRFSGSEITKRIKPNIENIYADDRISGDRSRNSNAEKARSDRYERLSKGLSALKNKSSAQRCRFELDFTNRLGVIGKEASDASMKEDAIGPQEECGFEHRIKDGPVIVPFVIGLLSLAYGFFVCLAAPKPDRPFFERAESARLKMLLAAERRKNIQGLGLAYDEADAIAQKSLEDLGYTDLKYKRNNTASIIRALTDYGFSEKNVVSILRDNPGVLNSGGDSLSHSLSFYENDGRRKPEEVRAMVLERPEILNF
ncbi:MAG: hypothetical protein V1827_06630 [Candidatus Micrarchaeota archaeon]